MTSHRLHKSAGRKERVSPNFPLFFYCIFLMDGRPWLHVLARPMLRAGKDFLIDQKKSGSVHAGGVVSDPPDENQSRLADFLIC